MTTKYRYGKDVPSEILLARLEELVKAITNGKSSLLREFNMSVPAELDRDADLVLSEAAARIKKLEAEQASHEALYDRVKELGICPSCLIFCSSTGVIEVDMDVKWNQCPSCTGVLGHE